MSLITVYSKSPISHQFSIVKDGIESIYVIKGTNSHQILTGGVEVPFVTQMEESVFNAIKEKYKDHPKLFGGVDPTTGIKIEASIYVAKTASEASKIMKDSKQNFSDNEIVSKTKDISKFKEDNH